MNIKVDLIRDWQLHAYNFFAESGKWKFDHHPDLQTALELRDFNSLDIETRNKFVSYYYNYRHRAIPCQSRILKHPPIAVLLNSIPEELRDDIQEGLLQFKNAAESGADLSLRLTGKLSSIDASDLFLDRYKIHHFHLLPGREARYNNYLAYGYVSDKEIKLISIDTHEAFKSEHWNKLLIKAYNLYPEEFSDCIIEEDDHSEHLSTETQKGISYHNINCCFWVGNKKIYPPGGGSCMDGNSTIACNEVIHDKELLRVANDIMLQRAGELTGEIIEMFPQGTQWVTFRLFGFSDPIVHAKTENGALRLAVNINTQRCYLSSSRCSTTGLP